VISKRSPQLRSRKRSRGRLSLVKRKQSTRNLRPLRSLQSRWLKKRPRLSLLLRNNRNPKRRPKRMKILRMRQALKISKWQVRSESHQMTMTR
jgi:hypothetical protein